MFLLKQIENGFVSGPVNKFMPAGKTRGIFETHQDRLKGYLREYYPDLNRVRKIVEGTLRCPEKQFPNILATLIHLNDYDAKEAFEGLGNLLEDFISPQNAVGNVVGTIRLDEGKEYPRLPLSREKAKRHFGDHIGERFFEEQYKFCPLVLRQEHSLHLDTHELQKCLFPILEESHIGQGAYGQVSKVRIPYGHLIVEKDGRDQDAPGEFFARKTFALIRAGAEGAFRRELSVIRGFMKASRKSLHRSIMVTLASVESKGSFSLFFPLARCDLHVFMQNESPPPSHDIEKKTEMIGRAAEIAGALCFLHTKLKKEDGSRLYCYHLDLKPDNILVMEDGRWMVTDFGMSRIKEGQRKTNLNELVSRRTSSPPSTKPRLGDSDYVAPETKKDEGKVTGKSDIWSFGCVLAVFFTWLDGGPEFVKEFQRVRLGKPPSGSSAFFSADKRDRLDGPKEDVHKWLNSLKQRAYQQGGEELRDIIKNILEFLQSSVLRVKPGERIEAAGLEKKLRNPKSSDHDVPLFHRFRSINTKQFQIFDATDHRCSFAAGGEVVMIFSKDKITVFLAEHIRNGHLQSPLASFDPFEAGGSDTWLGACICNDFVCAFTSNSYFDVSTLVKPLYG